MAARTLGMIAAIGVVAASAAQAADPPGGDIVDQIIQTMPPRPGASLPPSAATAAPSPAAIAPPPTAAVASPTPLAPLPPPTAIAPAAVAPSATAPAPLPPAVVASPTPIAVASPTPAPATPPSFVPTTLDSGDIVDQAQQASPPPPAPSLLATNPVPWTGFYVGANLGGGWTGGGNSSSCINSVTGTTSGCDIIGDGALNTSGIIGGGQFGYQMPITLGSSMPLVIGAEGDIQGTGISGSQNIAGPFNFVGFPGSSTCSPCSYTASQKINWFSTVRARIGVPIDNFLIYGTGGLIVGGVKASQDLAFAGGEGVVVNAKSTLSGPAVGGGVEMLLPGPWSVKLEALYYDMGSLKTVATPVNGAPTNFNVFKTFGFQGAMIRLGVTLHLGDIGAL
jgi:outer membrane immunogenic protein